MKQLSHLDAEQAKSFAVNHKNKTIVLKSYSADKETLFEASLTLGEYKVLCDFITENFKNDGRK